MRSSNCPYAHECSSLCFGIALCASLLPEAFPNYRPEHAPDPQPTKYLQALAVSKKEFIRQAINSNSPIRTAPAAGFFRRTFREFTVAAVSGSTAFYVSI